MNPLDTKPKQSRKRGFTLIEALVASTLLGMIVLAVISAVSASQRLSFEGQKQLLGVMAADDFLAELVTLPYDDLKLKHGLVQPTGELKTLDGHPYPHVNWPISRRVVVQEQTITEPALQIQIKGLRVAVTASDEMRDLAMLETFVPEPAP